MRLARCISCFVFVSLLVAGQPAFAAFHLWDIVEVYSNANGSVQYIELFTSSNSQEFVAGHSITANSDGNTIAFTFPSNSGSPTANKRLLIATPGFENEPGAVTPDFVLPSVPFFNPSANSITINFAEGSDSQTFSGSELPTNGTDSLNGSPGGSLLTIAPNTPTNFAGETGSLTAPPMSDLSAELPPPTVLVDNDADGKPNPSDTVRVAVDLRNSGDAAFGETQFAFTAPAATTILSASRTSAVSGTISFDSTSISATFDDVPGGGALLVDLVTFDLLIDNEIDVDAIELQASITYNTDVTLTDDPTVAGVEDPTVVALGDLRRLESSADPGGRFAESLAAHEQFFAVGEPEANGGDGRVSLYTGNGVLAALIEPPLGFSASEFGAAVSMHGDTLAVGTSGNVTAKGALQTIQVAIYSLNGGNVQFMRPLSGSADDGFGSVLALHGDLLVVGAPEEDHSSQTDAGAVYLFSVTGDGTPLARLQSDTPTSSARFGAALAVGENKIIIGAPGPAGIGQVFIYDRVAQNLVEAETPFDAVEFGAAVAFDGTLILAGAPGSSNGGRSYVFDDAGVRLQTLVAADTATGDRFGLAVAVSNGEYFIGAPSASVDARSGSGNFGAIYRFDGSGSEVQKIGAFSQSASFDQQEAFGAAVVATDTVLLIGAPETGSGQGEAALRVLPSPPALRVGHGSAQPGESVAVEVTYVGSNLGVESIQVDIGFDSTTLTPDLTNCGATLGNALISCTVVGSEVRISGSSQPAAEIPGGSLGELAFTVSAMTATPNRLSLTVNDETYQTASGGVTSDGSENGSITAVGSSGPAVIVGSTAGAPGGVALIPLTYTGSQTTVTDFEVDVAFDSSRLSADVSNCGFGRQTPAALVTCSVHPGLVRLTGISLSGSELGDADLGVVAFTIDSGAMSGQMLDLQVNKESYRDASDQIIGANQSTDGTITVSDAPDLDVTRGVTLISDGSTDDVGNQLIGSVSLTYTLTNSGTADLTPSAPTSANLVNVSSFLVAVAPESPIAPSDQTTTTIQFEVEGPGSFALDLAFASNDPDENPFEFTITGNGFGPEIDIQRPAGSDNSIPDGGTSNVGDRAIARTNLIYTVENLGNGDLSIDASPTATNLVNVKTFIVELGPSSPLGPGETTTFEVSFEVETNGPFNFDLSVGNSDADENPYDIRVTGNGVGGNPEIDVTRDSMSIADGTTDNIGLFPALSQSLTYTVKNSGDIPISIGLPLLENGVNVTDLEVAVPPSDSVPVAGQTTFDIAFTPVSVGDFSFDLSIDNNDADENPYNFQVAGKVPDAALSAELTLDMLLVDNDGDGIPNPSDTVRFDVDVRNSGETAAGETIFEFVAPEGTTITEASKANRPGLNDMISTDGITITGVFNDLEGPGLGTGGSDLFAGLVTFDLLIDNDIDVEEIQLQGSFSYGGEVSLTDDPSTIDQDDPTKVAVGNLSRLIAPETSRQFGEATALSEDFAVVGSPGDDGGTGAVSIYRILSDGRREFVDRITPPSISNGADSDFDGAAFGLDISLDGDVLVVGSADTGVAPKGATGNKVAVYQLFANRRPDLVAQINANLNSEFGTAVDIEDGMVVVGAPEENDGAMEDVGAVYMYALSNLVAGDDAPERRIAPDNPESRGRFGAAVACAGGKIVVGSPGPIGQALAGRAAIFDALTGMSVADIAAPFDGSGEFGAAVAIDGDRVMIGSPGAGNRTGGVFEYDLQGSAMGGRIISTDAASGDEFGKSLALGNGELLVGAPKNEVQGLIDVGNFGAIYRFNVQREQMQKIGAFSESSNQFEQQDGFGRSISVDGDTLLIGAPDSQDLRGAAAYQRGAAKQRLFFDSFECTQLLGCDSQ